VVDLLDDFRSGLFRNSRVSALSGRRQENQGFWGLVALKIIDPGMDTSDFNARFEAESWR
jgi:hypothetical protein